MPFILIRNDIAKTRADAIVNPANEMLLEGSGSSRAVFLAAGEEKLKKACRAIGRCDTGEAVCTDAFGLDARYIIHAVCPVWRGGNHGEEALLARTYTSALELAAQKKCTSVAFPLLSSGSYGFPKDRAMKAAIGAVSDFLEEHDMTIYMVLYDRKSVAVSRRLFSAVEEYIDDHYVDERSRDYTADEGDERRRYMSGPAIAGQRFGDISDSSCLAPSAPEASGNRGWVLERSGSAPAPASEALPKAFCAGAAQEEVPEPVSGEKLSGSPAAKQRESRRFAGAYRKEAAGSLPAKHADRAAGKRKLDKLLSSLDETFSERLLRLIDERGLKDSYVYKRANIDRRHFSKIRSNPDYNPTKRTVFAFAVALRLTADETRDLLMSAGYSISSSSRFDVIMSFFIENGIYDIFEINEMLFAYGEPVIGE